MNRFENGALIPFDLNTKGKCDNCRKSIRELFDKTGALTHKNGVECISLKTHSDFMHDTLYELKQMSVNSQTKEDYSFYASHAAEMVKKWMLFSANIMDMAVDPHNSSIKNDLFQAWETVNAELKNLVDHYVSSHKTLLQMGAPAPTIEVLTAYAESHNLDECEDSC